MNESTCTAVDVIKFMADRYGIAVENITTDLIAYWRISALTDMIFYSLCTIIFVAALYIVAKRTSTRWKDFTLDERFGMVTLSLILFFAVIGFTCGAVSNIPAFLHPTGAVVDTLIK